MPKQSFFTQKIHKIHFKPEYLPESLSIRILNLIDADNNYYALYKSDFLSFSKYLEEQHLVINELTTVEILDLINIFNLLQLSPADHLGLIKYFSPYSLLRFLLDAKSSSFAQDGTLITESGFPLTKKGHQNCIVMHEDGSIYVHPKIKANSVLKQFGVNHSSLAPLDSAIAFAGSFVHTAETGWILENTSGHYATRAVQMRHFVARLKELGFDLNPLTIKLWIPNDPKNHGDKKNDYTIIKENAEEFLERTSSNMLRLKAY